jgi:hypothetical protein
MGCFFRGNLQLLVKPQALFGKNRALRDNCTVQKTAVLLSLNQNEPNIHRTLGGCIWEDNEWAKRFITWVSKRKTRMCENIMLMNNEHKYRVATLSPVLMG